MSQVATESGSFRDRRGRIFYVDDRVLRTVMPMAIDDFDFVRGSGLVDALVSTGKLVGETVVDAAVLGEHAGDARLVHR